jgi:hypothetical protein
MRRLKFDSEESINRFFEKVEKKSDGCWLWLGASDKQGYGKVRREGKTLLAHRMSFQLTHGEIPDDLQLDHLCRVTSCVNPEHLEPVSQAENFRRGESGEANRAKTHCAQGHPFNEENTYINPVSGWRACRTCRREWDRKSKKKRRQG